MCPPAGGWPYIPDDGKLECPHLGTSGSCWAQVLLPSEECDSAPLAGG